MLFVNATIQAQTFTLNYPDNRRFNIPVACTPSIRRHLQSTGVSASVGRFWETKTAGIQLFVRVGAMMAQNFKYLRGIYPIRLPDRTPTSYLSGGSGTIIRMYEQVPQYNYLITNEIELTSGEFPFELAASVHLPVVQPTVFSELHTFAENDRFDKPLNKPITLLVNFEQSKANLLPDSHADLDALVQWLSDNPTA